MRMRPSVVLLTCIGVGFAHASEPSFNGDKVYDLYCTVENPSPVIRTWQGLRLFHGLGLPDGERDVSDAISGGHLFEENGRQWTSLPSSPMQTISIKHNVLGVIVGSYISPDGEIMAAITDPNQGLFLVDVQSGHTSTPLRLPRSFLSILDLVWLSPRTALVLQLDRVYLLQVVRDGDDLTAKVLASWAFEGGLLDIVADSQGNGWVGQSYGSQYQVFALSGDGGISLYGTVGPEQLSTADALGFKMVGQTPYVLLSDSRIVRLGANASVVSILSTESSGQVRDFCAVETRFLDYIVYVVAEQQGTFSVHVQSEMRLLRRERW